MEIHARFPNREEADGPCSNSHSGGIGSSKSRVNKIQFQENQELGKQLSSGTVAMLESKLQLQVIFYILTISSLFEHFM